MPNESQHTIRFRLPGVTVNLNSMGKGYALDRMAELLADHFVDDYLLHGGKSSILARGEAPGGETAGWTIGVRHPLRPAERLAELQLRDQALSVTEIAFLLGFSNVTAFGRAFKRWTGVSPVAYRGRTSETGA